MASLKVYAGKDADELLLECRVIGTNFNVVVEDDEHNIVASAQYNVPSENGDDS